MSEILAGAGPYDLTHRWYVDGDQSDVGTVTVGVVDGNGDEIVAPGTATTKTGSGSSTTYEYQLANAANVDRFTVTWTRSDTGAALEQEFEAVGGWLFTEAAARNWKGAAGQSPLASTSDYSDDYLADLRTEIMEAFASETGRQWVPRYCRAEFAGNGTRRLVVSDGVKRLADGTPITAHGLGRDIRRILSVTVGGVSVDVANVILLNGDLVRTDTAWARASASDPLNVVVEWEAGITAGVEAVQMALDTAMVWGVHTSVSPFATSMSSPDGSSAQFADGRTFPNRVWRWLRRNDVRAAIA